VDAHDLIDLYLEHRLGLARRVKSELHLVVDCANGSGCMVAERILSATRRSRRRHLRRPGRLEHQLRLRSHGADGPGRGSREARSGRRLRPDGDADRLISVDASGCVVDGDAVLGILALDRIARAKLPNGALVVSVLSNGGLQRAVEAAGGQIIRTPVGDKNILEGMLVNGAGLGGEKSGTSSSWSTPRVATASSPRSK